MKDFVTPSTAYFILSKTAANWMRENHIVDSHATGEDIMRGLWAAGSAGDIVPVVASKELRFMATVNLFGHDIVLLLVSREGAPSPTTPYSTQIVGVMSPEKASEVLRLNKGLTPVREFRNT